MSIIKYTHRDYTSLVKDFYDLVPKLTDLWKPEMDSDPGVVLGKYVAAIADMLGVNLDIAAGEMYGATVSQRRSAEKLFDLIGYKLLSYTAARTEVTFTNTVDHTQTFDFGFNGATFSTLNAYTDITGQDRVITYNILPNTSPYGANDTRNERDVVANATSVFDDSDIVTLGQGQSVTRVAVEGELRSYSVLVSDVKKNNYIINIPSQHIDTTLVWIRAKNSANAPLTTQWVQVATPADFIVPEPRFAVTYDTYSNAQIQVSNYLNQLENYDDNYLVIYWIDCTGVIGCVGKDVLSNYIQAKQPIAFDDETEGSWAVSNLSNTVEFPHTHTVVGKSPETAHEAYLNSRKYINTWNSLITLPDFNRFLNREPGVDCGLVIDCQKALEINKAIYEDQNLTSSQKAKKYITNSDFPVGDPTKDWSQVLNLVYDDSSAPSYVSNFKTYTAMCFAIHNDFKDSSYGNSQTSKAQVTPTYVFTQYKPPVQFIENVKADYKPLQAMTVDLEFGYLRLFTFYVVGTIYPVRPVTQDVAKNIIATVKEALSLYFAPSNRRIGQKPTIMEVVDVIRNAHELIDYFDAGSLSSEVIHWSKCDIEYFNPISFARYVDQGSASTNIQISPEYLIGD